MPGILILSGALAARWIPRVGVGRRPRNEAPWLWGAAGIVVVLAGGAMAVWGMFPLNVHSPLHFAGIMSPSCGITRSVVAVFRGDLAMAWRYNPLGPLVAVLAVAALVRLALGVCTGRWLAVRVRPGRVGWALVVLALVALEIRQQGRVDLLMSTGLY